MLIGSIHTQIYTHLYQSKYISTTKPKKIKEKKWKTLFYTNRFSMLELFSFWGVISFQFVFFSLSSILPFFILMVSIFSKILSFLFCFFSPFFHLAIFIVCCLTFFSLSLPFPFVFLFYMCATGIYILLSFWLWAFSHTVYDSNEHW